MFLSKSRVLFRNLNNINLNLKVRKLVNLGDIKSCKYFGSAVSHGHGNGHDSHHNDSHGHNSHGHDDSHDDHDHGHHEITGEVDLNKVYVPLNSEMSKFISLTGVPTSENQTSFKIEGECKAKAEITPISIPLITRNRVYYNDLANVRLEDNPYFHSEPYGYLISDDVKKYNLYSYYYLNILALGPQPYNLATFYSHGLRILRCTLLLENLPYVQSGKL